jgi:hypothetical protein
MDHQEPFQLRLYVTEYLRMYFRLQMKLLGRFSCLISGLFLFFLVNKYASNQLKKGTILVRKKQRQQITVFHGILHKTRRVGPIGNPISNT